MGKYTNTLLRGKHDEIRDAQKEGQNKSRIDTDESPGARHTGRIMPHAEGLARLKRNHAQEIGCVTTSAVQRIGAGKHLHVLAPAPEDRDTLHPFPVGEEKGLAYLFLRGLGRKVDG